MRLFLADVRIPTGDLAKIVGQRKRKLIFNWRRRRLEGVGAVRRKHHTPDRAGHGQRHLSALTDISIVKIQSEELPFGLPRFGIIVTLSSPTETPISGSGTVILRHCLTSFDPDRVAFLSVNFADSPNPSSGSTEILISIDECLS